ncbi:MAG TPA: hypothetical protein ENH82_01415 [bacterium]|nr:hypothetical protein [bacterium]
MPDKTSKILSIALYAVIGISVLFLILFYFEAVGEGLLIYWTYLLMIIATVSAVVFPVIFMIRNPKGTKKALIGIGAMELVFLIAYLIASDEVLPKYEKYGIDPSAAKRVGMGLIATYLFGFGAIGAIIYSAVSRFFK